MAISRSRLTDGVEDQYQIKLKSWHYALINQRERDTHNGQIRRKQAGTWDNDDPIQFHVDAENDAVVGTNLIFRDAVSQD